MQLWFSPVCQHKCIGSRAIGVEELIEGSSVLSHERPDSLDL